MLLSSVVFIYFCQRGNTVEFVQYFMKYCVLSATTAYVGLSIGFQTSHQRADNAKAEFFVASYETQKSVNSLQRSNFERSVLKSASALKKLIRVRFEIACLK